MNRRGFIGRVFGGAVAAIAAKNTPTVAPSRPKLVMNPFQAPVRISGNYCYSNAVELISLEPRKSVALAEPTS